MPKLIREVHRALSNAVQAGTSASKAATAVPVNKSVRNDHLPGVRQVVVDAEAASVDRASSYSWRLPAEMGVAGVVPDRGARLREGEVGTREEDRPRPEPVSDEGRTEELATVLMTAAGGLQSGDLRRHALASVDTLAYP